MPSRRSVLAGLGVATTGGLGGCSVLAAGDPGYVQLKAIHGIDVVEGVRHDSAVLEVELSSPAGSGPPELAVVDDRWADRFESPRTPTVSESLAHDLGRAFDDVRYIVGVCCPAWADPDEDVGCFNVATTRETLNGAQVHDRVRASSDGDVLTIHAVEGEWEFEPR